MTVEQIASDAQDSLIDVMQTTKVLRDEIIRLSKENVELKQQVEQLTPIPKVDEDE